jgi:hypothetical protein
VFGEHPDVQAVDEDHHPRAPEGPAQPDVVEPAPVADGDGAVLVDAGVADPDLSADPSFGPVGLALARAQPPLLPGGAFKSLGAAALGRKGSVTYRSHGASLATISR